MVQPSCGAGRKVLEVKVCRCSLSSPSFCVCAPVPLSVCMRRFRIGADASTTVSIKSLGMTAAEVRTVEVQHTNSTDLTAPGVGSIDFEVPARVTYVAVGIFDDDVPLKTDLDLFLY